MFVRQNQAKRVAGTSYIFQSEKRRATRQSCGKSASCVVVDYPDRENQGCNDIITEINRDIVNINIWRWLPAEVIYRSRIICWKLKSYFPAPLREKVSQHKDGRSSTKFVRWISTLSLQIVRVLVSL